MYPVSFLVINTNIAPLARAKCASSLFNDLRLSRVPVARVLWSYRDGTGRMGYIGPGLIPLLLLGGHHHF